MSAVCVQCGGPPREAAHERQRYMQRMNPTEKKCKRGRGTSACGGKRRR